MLTLIVAPKVRSMMSADEVAKLRRRVGRMVRAASLEEGADPELEASLVLTTDEEIHALNRDYRGKDRPTDVLAFSQREGDAGAAQAEVLGDIVISVETALSQAKHGLFAELMFLAAHGLCHLLGYDHNDDDEEAAMNARMKALLAEAERRGQTVAA